MVDPLARDSVGKLRFVLARVHGGILQNTICSVLRLLLIRAQFWFKCIGT